MVRGVGVVGGLSGTEFLAFAPDFFSFSVT